MPRPKKKKNNMEELSQQVLEAVTDAYLNPTEDTADENGKMSLNVLADEFSMSRIKLRKLLITAGVYETQISLKVNELYNSGKTIKEIQTITGLSAASVSGYLPYQKTIQGLKSDLILDICKATNASMYIAGPSGRDYLDIQSFKEAGIEVKFNDYNHPKYPQRKAEEFIPYLSSIDLFMNCGFEDGRKIIMKDNEELSDF